MTPSAYQVLFACLAFAIVASVWIVSRHMRGSRDVMTSITGGKEYRALADEYRRLSDMAITAQEHTDLRLTDIGVRLDELRSQVDQLQHILKEVE